MGAVPGDGVQAHLLSEKPKVATMATHLNKNGFYWIRKLHKNSFLNIFYLWTIWPAFGFGRENHRLKMIHYFSIEYPIK